MPYRLVRSADGFKGTFLFLAGLMFLPIGLSLLFSTATLRERNPALGWMPEFVQVWHLGALLFATALTASVIGLFSKRLRRWPHVIGWGFVAAMAPPTAIAALGIVALIYGGTVNVLQYTLPSLVLAAAIYLGSEWPNPPTSPMGSPPSVPAPDEEA